jgi:Zn-dependent protease
MEILSQIVRALKVRARLHFTWYLAIILIVVLVYNQFSLLYNTPERIALGVLTSLIFLLAISLRQFVLNFIASRREVPHSNLSLFVFGGAYDLAKRGNKPVFELLMGLTGLLTALALTLIFYLIHTAMVIIGNVTMAALTQWLAFITLALTFFNVIPGYPLDGGRNLLSLVWKKTGDYYLSAYIITWIGWVVGVLVIATGIFLIVITQQRIDGIAVAFLGFSMERAAMRGRRQASQRYYLRRILASSIMSNDYPVTQHFYSIAQLVREDILLKGQHFFIVADETELAGIITIDDIKSVPKRRWSSTSVGKTMTPANRVRTVTADQTGDIILEQMDRWLIEQMPVMDGNKVLGLVAKENLLRLSRSRAQLKI